MVRAFVMAALACLLLPATSASATPASNPAEVELGRAAEAAMKQAVAELMRPGPRRPDWDKGGVDLHASVERSAGGAAGTYLLSVEKDGGRSVTILGAQDPERLLPTGWTLNTQAGASAKPSAAQSLSIAQLDGPYHFFGWENFRPVGDAYCSTGSVGGRLYRSRGRSTSNNLPGELVPALFRATIARMEEYRICWRFDREGEGYRKSYFLEDGRTLPRLDEFGERVTLVPAAPVEELLVAR